MTHKSLRDEFIIKYKFEVMKRGVKEITFPDNTVSLLIKNAEQELQRELKIIESSQSITIVSGLQTYSLASDFGNAKQVRITSNGSNYNLSPRSLDELNSFVNSTGEAQIYATYFEDEAGVLKIYPVPTSGTISVSYYPDIANHTSTSILSSDFPFQDKYKTVVLYHMLSQIFDDYIMKFDSEMKKLKINRSTSFDNTLHYSFGEVSI